MAMAILMEPAGTAWLRDLNRLFGNETGRNAFVPPADVIVRNEEVTIYMDVPGMRAENLEVELEQDTLSVRGERSYPYGDDEDGVLRRIERGFGRFERSLRTPPGLDPDQVQAALADGVLTVTIPRPQPPQPRRVQITAGGEPRTIEAGSAEQPRETATA
jgi:HSP20 family protein